MFTTVRSLALIVFLATTLCSSCTESPEQIYQRLNTEAQQYFNNQQYTQAISTWNKLLSQQPDAPNINANIAKSYELNGQYPQAINAFQKHLFLHPESQATVLKIMQIQLMLRDIGGARTTWEKLKIFPGNPKSYILHGDLLASLNQNIAAITEYKRALSREPSNQLALARLAVLLYGQDKINEAEKFFHKLEAQHPESPEILLQMGNYRLLTDNRKKADLFLQKAIEQAPDEPSLRIKLAELYLDSGQFSQAAEIFKHLLEYTPQ
jgi:tetratricopeptide (TPR) repeat protein